MIDGQNNPGAMHELKTHEPAESAARSIGLVVPPHGEAALNYYKAAFERRRPDYVPDVIMLPASVRSDMPMRGYYAEPGEHKAESNQWGALSVKAANGKMLGIKPGEYEVISWRHNDPDQGRRA